MGRAHPPVGVCLPAAMLSVFSLKPSLSLSLCLSYSFTLFFLRSLFLSTKQTQRLQGNLGQQLLLSSISNSLCVFVTRWDTHKHTDMHTRCYCELCKEFTLTYLHSLVFGATAVTTMYLSDKSLNHREVVLSLMSLKSCIFSGCLGTCGFVY